MSATPGICPKCATPLPSDAPRGMCPECLLRGGFEDGDAGEPSPPPGGPRERTIHIVVPMDEAPGAVPETLRYFGDYELLEQIATGGMGVVFKARQVSLNRLVAVKMIRAGQLAREEDIRRFRTEAEAAANLKHPHIVAIHEVGEHEGRHFFSMDYIEGRSLAELVRDHPLEPERAARLVQTVAEAIAYAHGRGVLHRDLKPGNVMIDAQDQPHVTDFGLAKMLANSERETRNSELTQSGAVLGSPSYMSPEQARGRGDQVSVRSDVYALGAMLYELLTARPPFLAASALETMKLVAESDPVAPRVLNPSAPRDLETICLKCLQKEPAHRYASAAALAEDLSRWQRHEPIRARPTTVWEHAQKWARRHPARAALVSLSLAAPAVIIALLLVNEAKVRRERDTADRQRNRAESGELAAQERAYAADIYAAFQALAVNNLGLARRLMNEHGPVVAGATTPDLRGFEWRVLWERSRGQEAFAFTNLALAAECLAFAPDGRTLVSGGDNGIHLWDMSKRRPLGLFPGPDPGPPPRDISPKPEDLRPLLDSSPAVVEHLKAQPGILDYLDAKGHTNRTRSVTSLAFTRDGNHLLVGSSDFVRCWNFGTRAFEFAVPESDANIAMSSAGDIFVAANAQKAGANDERRSAHPQSTLVYSFSQRRLLAKLAGYGVRAAVSPDGQYVAAANRTNGVVLWRPATGETTRIASANWYGEPLAFSPDGRILVVGSDGRRGPRLWDVASRRTIAYLHESQVAVTAAAWSPDGRFLAGGGSRQTIGLWSVPPAGNNPVGDDGPPNLAPRIILRGHEASVTALAFSPDGRWLASAGHDKAIRFWSLGEAIAPSGSATIIFDKAIHDYEICGMDPETDCIIGRVGSQLALWNPQRTDAVQSLSDTKTQFHAGFLAQGAGFITVEMTTNGTPAWLEIRRLPDGAVQTRREFLPPPKEFPSDGAQAGRPPLVTPDGRWLAVRQSTDRRACVDVYAVATGRFVTRLQTPQRAILHRLCASPDSRWLILTEYDPEQNSIAIFDTSDWRLVRELHFGSPEQAVSGASVDPTSRFLATGGDDNSIRLWELLTGRLVGQCNGTARFLDPVWSPDGRTLAAYDDNIRLWSTTVFRELAILDTTGDFIPLGFTADGRALVTITLSGRVKMFTPPTVAEIDSKP